MSNTDKRRSDKIALAILEMLKEADGIIEKFKLYKETYGKVDVVEEKNNVLYPVSLREGIFIRKCIRKMGGNEWDWKKYIGLAMIYDEDKTFVTND